MAAKKLTLQEAEAIAGRTKPWTFRLENGNQFLIATGRGLNEALEITVGGPGYTDTKLKDWQALRVMVAGRLAEGFTFAPTDFVRMSPESLAKLTVPAPTPAPVTAPAASVTAPATPVPAPVAPAAVKYTASPSASLMALPAPHNQIRALRLRRDGTKILGYDGLDANGNKVVDLTNAEGLAFAQTHDSVEVVYR
jgi:hypothetical protein